MRVLALDQASRVTGWAVYDDKQLYAYGKISATHSDIGDRLYHIKLYLKISNYKIIKLIM